MVVRSRAPLRLSFAGGGTDVAPFPETEGGAVLSATIDRYAYGSLTPRADQRICVHSLDLGVSLDFDARDEPSFDGRLDLVKAAVRRLGGDGAGPAAASTCCCAPARRPAPGSARPRRCWSRWSGCCASTTGCR